MQFGILIFPKIFRYLKIPKICSESKFYKDWRANYNLLLSRSGLPHLSTRREFLNFVYFSIYSLAEFSFLTLLFPGIPHHILINIPIPFSSLIQIQQIQVFFFPSSVAAWNSLDFDVASMTSLLEFKHALTC